MGVYTDPKLLDVRGALDALPTLTLDAEPPEGEAVRATGTDGRAPRTVAPTPDNLVQRKTIPVNMAGQRQGREERGGVVVSGCSVKGKDPLTIAVSGSGKSGRQDGN